MQERLLHDIVDITGIGAQPACAGPHHPLVPLDQQPERHRITVPGQPELYQVPVGQLAAVISPPPEMAGASVTAAQLLTVRVRLRKAIHREPESRIPQRDVAGAGPV